MDYIRKYPGWSIAGAFILGLIIGLPILGWWLWPVEWTDATPGQLAPEYQQAYVRGVSELYAFTGDAAMVQTALGGWSDVNGDAVACSMAETATDPAERARLVATASVVNSVGCAGIDGALVQQPDAGLVEGEDVGGLPSWLLPALLLLGLLALVVGAIFYLMNRRAQETAAGVTMEPAYDYDYEGAAPPAARAATAAPAQRARQQAVADAAAVPIARFHTTYTYGHDAYDDSFSIENTNAEFLGECGVGIAESIGSDTPKRVTALEIWLFDKSDIRTITKVVMSDHAFFDDALKAKLAPKGEPVLARENETIVLETASLIINAEITEMQYGSDGHMPSQSYFERLTMSLSAWAKEGQAASYSAAVDNNVDDLMDF
jgi:hypothetical protein